MRHILIRPADLTQGGEVMTYTATEIAELYTAEEVACLAIGKVVQRGSLQHVDLWAFYDRHATSDTRGSVFLRHRLRDIGPADVGVAA
jgi:hypothetical protein